MGGHKRLALAAASILALASCSDGDPFDSWLQEAGAFVDEGQFGNPTMNNTLVQTGQRSFVVNLNNRFASEVPPTINFAFDSARLDADAQSVLMRQADWIRQFPEVRFKVFGHTDLVGTDAYNKGLGLRRANAVVRFLAKQGIKRSRLEAVVSFGETQPLIVTQERERKNRRTVTEVSGLVEKNPALLNGKYAALIFREYVASATESSTTGPASLDGTGG